MHGLDNAGQRWVAGRVIEQLADDSLEGRETGSEGLRKAESYVVDQFTKAGLQPAGTNGFYQPVKFISRQIVEKDSSAALVRSSKAEPLTLGEDAFFTTREELSSEEITAPLVFAGYGLKIPENNYDDLSGLDLNGKIVGSQTGSAQLQALTNPRSIGPWGMIRFGFSSSWVV